MHRRHFLTLTVGGVGGAIICGMVYLPQAVGQAEKTIRIPLRFFTEGEAVEVAAAAARIFPSDESGPGADEGGVVIYIDRQLSGPYGRDRDRYIQGPFVENAGPEFGYQGKATPREIYREGIKAIAGLHELPPELQDAKLKSIESTLFFALLRTHTIEGMFCDPIHGGNVNMAGWRLVGFPGPRMSYFKEVDQYYGREFRPEPISLEQAVGRTVKPGEEEA